MMLDTVLFFTLLVCFVSGQSKWLMSQWLRYNTILCSIITIIKSEVGDDDGGGPRGWLAGDGGRGQSGRGRHMLRCQPARSRR